MAVPSKLILYQDNDQYIEIDGLADELTGSYFNAATVTATLIDTAGLVGLAGSTVTGFPLTLSYVSASNGNYRGKVLYSVVSVLPLGGYKMFFDAIQGGTQLHIEIPVSVKIRKS